MSEIEQLPRLLVGVTKTAQTLGISRSYAYELVASGFLASVRLGRRVLVPISAIEDLVARGLDGLWDHYPTSHVDTQVGGGGFDR